MIHETIDLYNYFGVKRPQGCKGYLTTYVWDVYDGFKGKNRPAMLVIPGGAYAYVSNRESEPVALAWVEKGYNSFTLDYSVAPVSYPYQLCEACMAMAYIRENAEKYEVDANYVAAVGFSAGGHLCGTLATLFDDENVIKIIGRRKVSYRPDAVILSYAVLYDSHKETFDNISAGDDKLKKYLDVTERVTKNSSPAFIWHTRCDNCVPVDNSIKIANAYNAADVPFALHIFDRGYHGLSVATNELIENPQDWYLTEDVSSWVNLAYIWLKNSLDFKIS